MLINLCVWCYTLLVDTFHLNTYRTFKFLSEDSTQFRKVSTGDFQPNEVYMVELKGLPFPVYLTKQVFQNGDGKEVNGRQQQHQQAGQRRSKQTG